MIQYLITLNGVKDGKWDDDLNPLMPKFSAYNLDDNMLKIEVIPNVNNTRHQLLLSLLSAYVYEFS